jgi:transposase-like protein
VSKTGERAAPPCPRCGRGLRVKAGTTSTTPGEQLRFQCRNCFRTHPTACEWHPQVVAMLNEMKANGDTLSEDDLT